MGGGDHTYSNCLARLWHRGRIRIRHACHASAEIQVNISVFWQLGQCPNTLEVTLFCSSMSESMLGWRLDLWVVQTGLWARRPESPVWNWSLFIFDLHTYPYHDVFLNLAIVCLLLNLNQAVTISQHFSTAVGKPYFESLTGCCIFINANSTAGPCSYKSDPRAVATVS